MDEFDDEEPAGAGLVLVGYRGTGKTTVARLLADRTGRPFIDTDEEIQARAGCSIPELFAREGEAGFRDLEERVLAQVVKDSPGAILATGGGVVLRPSNVNRIRRHGRVVWLTADPEILALRIARDTQPRPALTSAGTLGEIGRVLASREALYRRAAHETVATAGLEPMQVADRVLSLVGWDLKS